LEFYCKTHNILSGWNKKPDIYEIYESDWSILGGGWINFKTLEKSATVFGQSTAYGKYNSEVLSKLFDNSNNLNGFIISKEFK